MKEKITNSVLAKTQPCFTPLMWERASRGSIKRHGVPRAFVVGDKHTEELFSKSWNRPFSLTRSNDFVGPMMGR